jgi:hypothetical protein
MAAEIVTIQGELTLDPEVEARCEERHQQAMTHQSAGAYHWLEAGRLHAENKAEIGSRKWGPWCEKHNIPQNTVDKLIRVAGRFGSILADSARIDIPFDALLALASPTAPVAAAEEAVRRASDGERITKAEAQRLIAKARHDDAIKAAEEMQAKLAAQRAEEAARLTDELRQHELVVSAKDREIAELKLAAATAAQTERDKHAADLEGKLVVSEDELRATVERLMEPMQVMLDNAQKDRDKAIAAREKATARLDQLHKEQAAAAKAAAAGKPHLPPLDSNLSFSSMVARQAIEACFRDIKLTPTEMIRIEVEFSTRLHDNPGLARAKLDQIKSTILQLIPWFNLFLETYTKEYGE